MENWKYYLTVNYKQDQKNRNGGISSYVEFPSGKWTLQNTLLYSFLGLFNAKYSIWF